MNRQGPLVGLLSGVDRRTEFPAVFRLLHRTTSERHTLLRSRNDLDSDVGSQGVKPEDFTVIPETESWTKRHKYQPIRNSNTPEDWDTCGSVGSHILNQWVLESYVLNERLGSVS